MKKILPVIIILLSCNLYAQVPEIAFDRVRVSSGTPTQEIANMCQDNFGFLWVGSDNGVDKFDGYSFSNYRSSETNPNSLCNNAVGHIFFDSFGYLWVATQEGLNRFDAKSERFTQYFHHAKDPTSIGDNLISPFYEDAQHNLWVGTYGGISFYNREKNNFTTYSHQPNNANSLSHNTVSCIYMDRKGFLWVGTWGGGLNRFDLKTKQWTCYRHDPNNPNSISHDFVRKVFEDKAGRFWVGTTGGGLNEFNPTTGAFTHYMHDARNPQSISDNFITSMLEDDAGNIWLGTWNGGLNIFDVKKRAFSHFRSDPDNPNSLISDCITSIFRHQSGIIFLGTYRGLNQVRFIKNTFRFYTGKNAETGASLNDRSINAICEDNDGNLWLGTYRGGLNKFDKKTGRYSYYNFVMKSALMTDKIEVTGIVEDKAGHLWVSTVGSGLFKFNRTTGSYKNYSSNLFLTSNNYRSTFLFQDKKGYLWIGYPNGVVSIFDPVTEQFSQIKVGVSELDKAFVDEINCITEDSEGNKWVAVRHKGIFRIDVKTGAVERLSPDGNGKTNLSDNDVKALCLSNDSILWIGTTNGFNRYNTQTKEFKSYFVHDGLPDIIIRSITCDKNGILWIGTHKGLSRFDPKTERFNNYDERDGVMVNQFNASSFYSAKRGQMYLGGYNGFIQFNPDSIKIDTTRPRVYITGLEVHGKPVNVNQEVLGRIILKKSMLFTDKISISYRQNNFTLHFISLHYKMPDRNQCAYMLEGYDKTWRYTVENKSVNYMNLKPGVYTFKVRGSNADGFWNEEGDTLTVVVHPPWWFTWWMYVLYFLTIVSGLIFYINYRSVKHKQENIRLQQLVNERTLEVQSQNQKLALQTDELRRLSDMRSRFFTYLSHEFRTPLTMILGPLQQIFSSNFKGNIEDELKNMMRSSRRLLHLIDELLDLSKLEKGNMQLKASFNTLNPFLKRITLSFQSIAENKKVDLRFIEKQPEIKLYFDHEKLEKVFNNLISNALKYTSANGKIRVEVGIGENIKKTYITDADKFKAGWVEVKVKDNGVGIEEDRLAHIFEHFYHHESPANIETKGWGVGLTLVKELVELHHGEIQVSSKLGEGTTFYIYLPLGDSHLKPNEMAETTVFTFENEAKSKNDILYSPQIEHKTELKVLEKRMRQTPNAKILDNQKRFSVLIVEDNFDVRKYVAYLLADEYVIWEAENGKQGVAMAFEHIPDLIISDVMMPEMDGIELCRSIKNDIHTSHIPVILLTSKAGDMDKIEGIETGADDYLIKPFNPVELVTRVKNLIELRQQLQQKYRKEMLLSPTVASTASMDERFLEKVKQYIEKHISDSELTVEHLYSEIGMSRSGFHAKFTALTGQPANHFIRSYRLKKAALMIEKHTDTIAQIAYTVGFVNPAYFAKSFKTEFGISPTEYATKFRS